MSPTLYLKRRLQPKKIRYNICKDKATYGTRGTLPFVKQPYNIFKRAAICKRAYNMSKESSNISKAAKYVSIPTDPPQTHKHTHAKIIRTNT